MDSDLSHEALERFEAIETRLDALEGGGPAENATEQGIFPDADEE